MKIDLDKFRQASRSQRKENQKFFSHLRSVKPGVLDQQFHQLHEEVFSTMNCLTCANCCKTTGPLFTEADIDRLARHSGLKPSAFIDKFLRVDEDGDFVLKTVPCPFLKEDNHCSVYEVRPRACREYPHTDRKKMHQILELTRKNAEMCPAVLEIVHRMKKNNYQNQ